MKSMGSDSIDLDLEHKMKKSIESDPIDFIRESTLAGNSPVRLQ